MHNLYHSRTCKHTAYTFVIFDWESRIKNFSFMALIVKSLNSPILKYVYQNNRIYITEEMYRLHNQPCMEWNSFKKETLHSCEQIARMYYCHSRYRFGSLIL